MVRIIRLRGGISCDRSVIVPAFSRESGQDSRSVDDMVIQGKLTIKEEIHLIWEELQRQLDDKGYSIKWGTHLDASIITSDPGHVLAEKTWG